METMPAICPGHNKTVMPNATVTTFQATIGSKNNTSVVFYRDGTDTNIVSSFWMNQGTYD